MTFFRASFFSAALLAAALLLCESAAAQGVGNLFNVRKDSKGKSRQSPTVITAESMDIDLANNIATFIGNVEVDDSDMNIKCHKMIIHLEDAKKDEDKPSGDSKDDEESEFGNKQVIRVECIGDVVIVRKFKDPSGKLNMSQKALAGKADYDLKAGGKITLEEDPVIIRDKDRITGERIILYRDSERMQILGKGSIKTAGEEEAPEEDKDKPKEDGAKPGGNPSAGAAK